MTPWSVVNLADLIRNGMKNFLSRLKPLTLVLPNPIQPPKMHFHSRLKKELRS